MNSTSLSKISKQISSGLTPLRSNMEFWDSNDVPWVKTEQLGEKNIYDSNEKVSFKALKQTSLKLNPINTLSIAMYGEGRTRGSVSILKSEMTTNQACCNIVIDEKKADYEYIYYFLKTQYNQLRSLSSGVRKNLNSNDIKNFEIRIPNSITTQSKIAKVLSDLDAKIELNTKINTELEAMAKLIYDYWFVQFDFPNEEGKPYKSSGGKMVWNEELKREIPEGWEVGTLNEICDIINGYAFKSEWYKDEGVKIIRTKNFEEGYVNLNDLNYLEKEFSLEFEKYQLNLFDFLMVMVGASTGKYCVVNSNILPALQNQNMWRFVSKTNSQLFLNLKLRRIIVELERTTNGSARGFFQKDTFLNKKIEIPSETIVRVFSKKVDPIFRKIDNTLFENQKLAELRDWLLPMLMNGQVKVS